MSMSDELERLDALRRSGVLDDDEFAALKRRLVESEDKLGQAAADYVGLQKVMAIIGVIGFVIMFIFITGQMGRHDERVSDMRDRFFKDRLHVTRSFHSKPDRPQSTYSKTGENNSDKGKRDAN